MFKNNNNHNSIINFAPADTLFYLRLLLVAAGGFAVAVGTTFAVEKFRWQGQAQEIHRAGDDLTTTVYPRLDPNVRRQLEKALAPDNLGLSAAQNPFIDRANLASQKPAVLQSLPTAGVPKPPPLNGFPATLPPNQLPRNNPGQIAAPENSALSELNNRLRERDRLARAGRDSLEPLSTVYDVDDLEPIGVIGKSQASEVLFRSKTTKKVFSAPLGARFNNGTLRDAESTGVIFVRDADKSVEKKFWVKSKPVKDTEAEPTLPVNPKN